MKILSKQLLGLCGLASLSGSIWEYHLPNLDFIPRSKFSILKIGPNTKQEIFENFVKFCKI